MIDLNLKQCQYILKIYEIGNITRAANELFITQPALSHYLSKLEKEIGAPIFQRGTQPLKLTPAGELYIRTAKEMMAAASRLEKDLEALSDIHRGTVRVGMSHSRAAFLLPYMINIFQEKYPDAKIIIVENGYLKGEIDLMEKKTDFAVMPLSAVSENFSTKLIMKDELMVVSREELPHETDPGTGHTYVDFDVFRHHKCIVVKKGHGTRKTIDTVMKGHDIIPDYVMESDSNENVCRLASGGMGLGIVPKSVIRSTRLVTDPFIYSISKDHIRWDIVAVFEDWGALGRLQKDLILLLRKTLYHGSYHGLFICIFVYGTCLPKHFKSSSLISMI